MSNSTFSLSQAEAFNSLAWILNNKIVNENGSSLEFADHSFMIDPFLDNSERQVAEKCSQIGWSTLAILRSFHLARYAGANIIHTFPSRNMSKDFVIPKVNPLIQRNPSIKAMVGTDSLNLKQVGDRFIYYRGSYEQTEAISISAHILINDEYDRSNQKVLKTYRSRLDDAKRERPELGWEWRFSNPSIPGYGVDELWQKSDQKHWFVKCSHCNRDWYLDFPENINFDTKQKVCDKCHKPFSKYDLTTGRWVNKAESKISGYWISQMFVPWISATKIIEDSEGDPGVFHNFTLGKPFISKDASVSRQAILRCIVATTNSRAGVAIGVDNGITKHYVVGNRTGIFLVGETKDWGVIEDLRNKFNATMVIDALPYPNEPTRMMNKYRGKVFLSYYQPDKRASGMVYWDYDDGIVRSDRTKIIDFVVAEINSNDVKFNLTANDLDQYIWHWQQLYRVVELNTQGILKPKWKCIEARPDHYAHATVFWRLALEQTLGQGGVVGPTAAISLKDRHQEVGPDSTVPALNLEEVVRRASFGPSHRSWKVR
jgi:hypothetical protein